MEKTYTEKQKRIKEQFYRERGQWKWNDTWETMLELNEDLLSSYCSLSAVAHKHGQLDIKTKTLIYVAMDGAITHLYLPGMGNHLRHGIRDLGITPGEMMETFVIASTIGASTYSEGFPVLLKLFEEKGIYEPGQELTAEEEGFKNRFIKLNGYWNPVTEAIVKMDRDIFEAYLNYMEGSLGRGFLEPKTREFIYIALNAASTTLNKAQLWKHAEKALELGATKEELLEIFELACCLGVHTIMIGIPILNEAVQQA